MLNSYDLYLPLFLLGYTIICSTSAQQLSLQATLNHTYACCMPLGSQMQLWWQPFNATHFNFALVGDVADDQYLSFGPVQPGSVDRLMGGSNTVAGGVNSSSGVAWAADMYLGSYSPCDLSYSPPVGVCPLTTMDPSLSSLAASQTVQLIAASRKDSVTTLLLSRPLRSFSSGFGIGINLNSSASYIWTHGPMMPGNQPPSLRMAQHGISQNHDYGSLLNINLGATGNGSLCGVCQPMQGLASISSNSNSSVLSPGFAAPVLLAGGGVSVSWMVGSEGITFMVSVSWMVGSEGITFMVTAMQAAGWASIAIGQQMTGAHAYVAWSPKDGVWRVDGYSMTSLDATGLTRTTLYGGGSTGSGNSSSTGSGSSSSSTDSGSYEQVSNVTVARTSSGIITFSFYRPWMSTGGAPAIDASALSLIWALGSNWQDPPNDGNNHFIQSAVPTVINLLTSSAASGASIPPSSLLVAHGIMLAVAYAVLMPAAAFAARYLKLGGVVKPPTWFSFHVVVAILSVVTALAGTGLALAFQFQEYGGGLSSIQLFSYPQGCTGTGCNRHSSIGVAAIVLLVGQPINAMIRPHPVPAGEPYRLWSLRRVWEIFHRVSAVAALGTGIAAVFSGIQLSTLFDVKTSTSTNLQNGLIVWLSALAAYVFIREVTAVSLFALIQRGPKVAAEELQDMKPSTSPAGGKNMKVPAGSLAESVASRLYHSIKVMPHPGHLVQVRPPSPKMDQSIEVEPCSAGSSYNIATGTALHGSGGDDCNILENRPVAEGLESIKVDGSSDEPQHVDNVKYISNAASESGTSASARHELLWAWTALGTTLLAALFALLVSAGVLGGAASKYELSIPDLGGSTMMPPPFLPPDAVATIMPPLPPLIPALASCSILSVPALRSRLGDGWCDSGAPYNTLECGYDGGDCCNPYAPLYECVDPASPNYGKSATKGLVFPAPVNPLFTDATANRSVSSQGVVTTYNNFYEFTESKTVSTTITPTATQLMTLTAPGFPGWTLVIDGLVANPITLDVRDLIKLMHVEQRVLRHRCVETWALVVPWIGFPLRKILSLVNPLPNATYVRFESAALSAAMPLVKSNPIALFPGVPWPYVEGLSIEEAWNDMAFLAVGMYNSTLPAQNGAPIRMILPWKYGFKSIKSLVRISFVDYQPDNWWQEISSAEYGFWANVNPAIPHPRWSQATETLFSTTASSGTIFPTVIYNGYGNEVSYLYQNATSAREYFY
ncbi:hypothetical protein CEUSTIGMA_g12891.t1 [Chlamydomonas eustigma]|uniref:DOMON domain-containing protein n=1 Tax=Chlamydomonas eustigma TaxID=1157962 RepID=A0A250XQZ2_9CHLO|nr:hypothetical protein CEUSTIGMA_g12891.t1 [Chlamydomonas eustigma]|eukprot:GAX85475.1 hypothetical protein CEUSTIGMA_g12891.t1 [Chlamydomonas eustigma]